jgi:hypothetical protein
LPAIFVAFYLFLVIMLLVNQPRESGIGLLFILAGLIAYLLLSQADDTLAPG